MKSGPHFITTTVVAGLTFIAGVWCGPRWFPHLASPSAATSRAGSELSLAAPASASPDDALILSVSQIQADRRALATSPHEFIASLRSLGSLQASARLTAALAGMSLTQIEQLAPAIRDMNGSPDAVNKQFALAATERWAELNAESLLEAVRKNELGYAPDVATTAFRYLAKKNPDAAWQQAKEYKARGMMGDEMAQSGVVAEVARTDPAKALSFLQDGAGRFGLFMATRFIKDWFRTDKAAALQAVEKLPHGEIRSNAFDKLAAAFAERDPEAALIWATSLKNGPERSTALSWISGELARKNPQRLVALAERPEFTAYRKAALTTVVSTLASKDFDAALSFAQGMKDASAKNDSMRELSRLATSAQQQQLLALASSLPPAVAQEIYQSVVMSPDTKSLSQVEALLAGIKSPSVREEVLKTATASWGGLPLEDKLQLFAKLQSGSRNAEQAENLASELVKTDPSKTLAWAAKLETPALREVAVKSMFSNLSYADPASAAQQIGELTDPAMRETALKKVASIWQDRDATAAMAWAETLPGKERTTTLGAMVKGAANADPVQAKEVYAKYMASLDPADTASSTTTQLAGAVAAALAQNDPPQALAWAASLGSGFAQTEAWSGLAKKWAEHDPRATSEWVATLPSGEGRDAAAHSLVTAIANDDPSAAWAWATSIGEASQRREAAARTLEAWKSYGQPDEARAALDAAGFSADDAKELAKKLE